MLPGVMLILEASENDMELAELFRECLWRLELGVLEGVLRLLLPRDESFFVRDPMPLSFVAGLRLSLAVTLGD